MTFVWHPNSIKNFSKIFYVSDEMPCKQITVIKVLNRSLSCACKELYKVLLHLILKLQSHIIPIIEDKHVIISIWNDLS